MNRPPWYDRERELERELLRDHPDAWRELSVDYFRDFDTEPGPTPQGRPGASRDD